MVFLNKLVIKLLIHIGLLVLSVIIVECHLKINFQSEEDCLYQNVIANADYRISWNTTSFPGHQVSLKVLISANINYSIFICHFFYLFQILSSNLNGVADNGNILVHVTDLQLQPDAYHLNFFSPEVGSLWICTIIDVQHGITTKYPMFFLF